MFADIVDPHLRQAGRRSGRRFQYIHDFGRLAGTTKTARELYEKMLELDLERVNPLPLLAFGARPNRKLFPNERSFLIRRLQLVAHGEPSDVIELNTVSEPALGQEDVLVSMEAAPLNPSDFLFVRGTYSVRPAFPSSVGAEGVVSRKDWIEGGCCAARQASPDYPDL